MLSSIPKYLNRFQRIASNTNFSKFTFNLYQIRTLTIMSKYEYPKVRRDLNVVENFHGVDVIFKIIFFNVCIVNE